MLMVGIVEVGMATMNLVMKEAILTVVRSYAKLCSFSSKFSNFGPMHGGVALGFHLRASHLLGRHSYHFSQPTSPFLGWDLLTQCFMNNFVGGGFEPQSSSSLPLNYLQ
jgi:hypothetical protein